MSRWNGFGRRRKPVSKLPAKIIGIADLPFVNDDDADSDRENRTRANRWKKPDGFFSFQFFCSTKSIQRMFNVIFAHFCCYQTNMNSINHVDLIIQRIWLIPCWVKQNLSGFVCNDHYLHILTDCNSSSWIQQYFQ